MNESHQFLLTEEALPRTSCIPESSQKGELDLSIVIPIFNEEECLVTLWDRLFKTLANIDQNWEVVCVDDGSSDKSLERLLLLGSIEPRVTVLHLDKRSGQTAALDAGFRAARGNWILTLDADLQNPPEEIPILLAASNGVDLVFGRRIRRSDTWIRKMSSRVGNGVRNMVTGHRIVDTGCSLKLYRTEALRHIPLFNGMHRFFPTLFAAHGFRIKEVSVHHEPRAAGTSKYGVANRIWCGLLDCFAMRWMRSRSLRYAVSDVKED